MNGDAALSAFVRASVSCPTTRKFLSLGVVEARSKGTNARHTNFLGRRQQQKTTQAVTETPSVKKATERLELIMTRAQGSRRQLYTCSISTLVPVYIKAPGKHPPQSKVQTRRRYTYSGPSILRGFYM